MSEVATLESPAVEASTEVKAPDTQEMKPVVEGVVSQPQDTTHVEQPASSQVVSQEKPAGGIKVVINEHPGNGSFSDQLRDRSQAQLNGATRANGEIRSGNPYSPSEPPVRPEKTVADKLKSFLTGK